MDSDDDTTPATKPPEDAPAPAPAPGPAPTPPEDAPDPAPAAPTPQEDAPAPASAAPAPPEDAPDPAPAAPTPPEDAPAPAAPTPPEDALAPAPAPAAPTPPEEAPTPAPPEDAPASCPLHPQATFRLPYLADSELSQRRAAARARQAAERERRAAERERERYRRRRRAVAETSQSTAEILGFSNEEGLTIMDTGQQQTLLHEEDGSSSMDTKQHQRLLHEEDQLPDWMSQLFEKLDLEASKDDGSIGEFTQAEAHPLAEEDISFEIQRSSEEKDSTMSENRELEANRDGIGSLDKISQVESLPRLEGSVPAKDNYFWSCLDPADFYDTFDDWFSEMLKLGGYEDDVSSLPEVDQEEGNSIDSEEFYDLLDKEVKEYCKNMKKVSDKKTIENGFKWMSEECFLAFTKSAEKLHFEGIEHKFGEIHSQCFSVESHDKNFHHYNFTVEEKHENSNVWTSKLYFAEVKQLSGVKSFLCCPLELNDCGHCYGCKNQDMHDLKHPSRGGYDEGHSDICWPFMDDPDYDSDSDDGCVLGY